MAFFKPWGDNEDSLTNQLLQLSQWYTGQMDKQKTSINADLEGAGRVISSSMTQEQLINARKALDNLQGRSSDFGETSFNYQAMSNALENRQYAYNEYKGALEQYGDYMNSDMYITKAEDWTDLDALLEKKREAGENYDSVVDMMTQEYARIGMLSGKIAGGKTAGFYFKGSVGGGKYNTADVDESLLVYGGRLDSGLQALMGDGTINIDEAEQIMASKNVGEFKEYRNRKLVEVKDLINDEKSEISSLQNIQKRLLEGSLKDATDAEMNFLQQAADNDETGTLQNYLNRGDTDALKKELDTYINQAQKNLNTAYTNYKNWSGSAYGDMYTGDKELDKLHYTEEELKQQGIFDEEDWMEQGDKELKEREDKELIERYGTADRKEIKAIIEREIEEGKTASVSEILTDIKDIGVKDTVKKVGTGKLGIESFQSLIDNADLRAFKTDKESVDKLFNAKIHDNILAYYEQLGIKSPSSLLELLQSRPSVESLEKAFYEQYPEKKLNFTEEQKKNLRTDISHNLWRFKDINTYQRTYDSLVDGLESWANLDKDASGMALEEFLSGDISYYKAWNKGADESIKNKTVKRSYITDDDKEKLLNFKEKYLEAKKSGITLEEFIKQNEAEYRNVALVIKYGKQILARGTGQN